MVNASNERDVGSILGRRTKIPHTACDVAKIFLIFFTKETSIVFPELLMIFSIPIHRASLIA